MGAGGKVREYYAWIRYLIESCIKLLAHIEKDPSTEEIKIKIKSLIKSPEKVSDSDKEDITEFLITFIHKIGLSKVEVEANPKRSLFGN